MTGSVHAHFLGPPYLSDTQAERARTCTLADLRGDAVAGNAEPRGSPPSSKPDADSAKTLVAFLAGGQGRSRRCWARQKGQKKKCDRRGGGTLDALSWPAWHQPYDVALSRTGDEKQGVWEEGRESWNPAVRTSARAGRASCIMTQTVAADALRQRSRECIEACAPFQKPAGAVAVDLGSGRAA
ncbi:hypothetical protein VTO73DRAFT_4808 [Trametes versicolor]